MNTKHIHEKLKELRAERNFSQETIAQLLEISKQQINNIENGTEDIDIYMLKTLCAWYNISADYILGLPRGLDWPR